MEENKKNIRFKDLKKGDVLLCKGDGLLSDLIELFDEGTYSHAAIFDGEQVVQATLHGVVRESIDSLKDEVFVDVYRFKKDNHFLGDKNWPALPVIKEADKIGEEGLKYATDHLILLGILVLTRDIDLPKIEKKILRVILDHATELLFKIMDDGKTPMVCSEVVYRSFSQAVPEGKYTLEIEGVLFTSLKTINNNIIEKDELFDSKQKFYEAWKKARGATQNLLYSKESFDPAVAACVTPHDLETSKTLVKIGRYVFS
jgi:hypothetical protein